MYSSRPVLQDVLHWALLDDPPLVEREQPVRDGSRTEQVVVIAQQPRAALVRQPGEPGGQGEHRCPQRHVDHRDRLVTSLGLAGTTGSRSPCYPVTVKDLVIVAFELSPT